MNGEACLDSTARQGYPAQDEAMECAICHKKGAGKTCREHGAYGCNDCHTQGVDSAGRRCPVSPTAHKKPKVAFLCVHNSCRSQMAEALGKQLAGDVFESFSAGTEPACQINPDAVRLMRQIYGIDMEQTQHNKPLDHLPAVDIVVIMGCNVQCPTLPCSYREDWGLDDPSGKEDSAFLAVMTQIEKKVLDLKRRIQMGELG